MQTIQFGSDNFLIELAESYEKIINESLVSDNKDLQENAQDLKNELSVWVKETSKFSAQIEEMNSGEIPSFSEYQKVDATIYKTAENFKSLLKLFNKKCEQLNIKLD